jgi:hypothetical protein
MSLRTRTPLLAIAFVLVLGVVSSADAQSALCEPSPEIRLALRNLPDGTGDAQADRAAELAALKALLKRFPDNVWVHHRYQDSAMYPTEKDRDGVIAEYAALAAKHAKDPVYAYLAARAGIGSATKEILPELEKVAAQVPTARISLARIYQSTAFKDATKAQAALEAFTTACPASLTALNYIRSLQPSEFVRKSTEHMRDVLAKRSDLGSLSFYTTLWSLEFRVKPAAEHDALRKQIAEDLKRMRAVPGKKDATYYSDLQQGYKLANDTENAKWASEQLRALPGRSGFYEARDAWYSAHPYKANDSPDVVKARSLSLAEASAEWVRRWPNELMAWFDRVGALASPDVTASAADIETAGENLLRAAEKDPDALGFMSQVGGNSFSLVVAHLYAAHGVRPDRLPDLVRQGLSDVDHPLERGWRSDLYPMPARDDTNDYLKWYGRLTVADIWLYVKDATAARKTLLDLQTLADNSKPKSDAKDANPDAKQRTYLLRLSEYWQRMGMLAHLEGHTTDAMTFYQNALLARPTPPPAGRKDDLAEKARALWTDLGGSNEAWQTWFSRREYLGGGTKTTAAGLTFTTLEKKLPEFELADLAGRKWHLSDFKGKPTLVGIWATW